MQITFQASTLTASKEDRLITGTLIPYGEKGQTNLGMFSVPRGAFEIPKDPAQITVNVEHEREGVFGHGVRLTDSPEGLMFAAYAAKTPEGDRALADATPGPNGEPPKLGYFSAEVANVQIQDGRAVGGRVFGAALVTEPAFPSATLLASAVEDEDGNTEIVTEDESAETNEAEDGATETVEKYTDEITDEDGNTTLRETTITTVEDGSTTTITTETVVIEPEETNEEEEEPIVATLTASARRGATRPRPVARITTQDRPTMPDLGTLYAAISDARVAQTPDAMDTLLAALTELKTTGSLGPKAGGGTNKGLPDNWMGQLWDGREYDRKFIHLAQLGTGITATGKRGYRAQRGTKAAPVTRNDGTWAGELAAINSANAYIEETSSTLRKWALANTIAREFFDLPGGAEFIEAFFKLLVEDYAIWSDETALRTLLVTAGAPIAPENHLAGYPATHQYPAAMVMLIQGIRTVNRRGDSASFAVVNKAAYDQLVYTPKDLIPEYISFDVSTERGGSADSGKVTVVEADSEDVELFTDHDGDPVIDADEPAVLVGAKRAVEFDELGSTPLTVDALEIAKGGVDRAVHGYLQEHVVRPRSLALIGTAVTGG